MELEEESHFYHGQQILPSVMSYLMGNNTKELPSPLMLLWNYLHFDINFICMLLPLLLIPAAEIWKFMYSLCHAHSEPVFMPLVSHQNSCLLLFFYMIAVVAVWV